MNGPHVRLAIGTINPSTRRAIDAAIRLARSSGGTLDVVFVEETELFDAAALPCTREMGTATRGPRRLDARMLAGALKRQADQARHEVADAARRSHVAATFDVARGRLLREPLERAGSRDLVVIGAGGYELAPAAPVRAEEHLLAVVESLPDALAMLRTALGALPGARTEVWARPGTAGARLENMMDTLERELGRPLRRAATPQHNGEPSVAEMLVQVRPGVLAINRESLVSAPPELIRALRRLGVTVLASPAS